MIAEFFVVGAAWPALGAGHVPLLDDPDAFVGAVTTSPCPTVVLVYCGLSDSPLVASGLEDLGKLLRLLIVEVTQRCPAEAAVTATQVEDLTVDRQVAEGSEGLPGVDVPVGPDHLGRRSGRRHLALLHR